MRTIFRFILTGIFLLTLTMSALADLKIRQRVTMSGQTFETTKMIKGARQRTENKSAANGGTADFMAQVATIMQCDLRRTVRINDSKKLYFIEPFADENNTRTETSATKQPVQKTRRGGTVTMTFSVRDTGERKTLFGLTARHLIIVQETEASPDSCSGASRSKMEIDGWYVDFSAEFTCSVDVSDAPVQRSAKPDCQDRIITKQSGSGKTGFLLSGTTKFYDETGEEQMTQTIETLELSRTPLAAELFDIPQGYKLASSSQDLYSMPGMTDLMNQQNDEEDEEQETAKNTGAKTIGININLGGNTKINQLEISAYLRNKLRENNFDPRSGASDADYVLNVELKKVKESAAGKVGGIFGKVTGVETKTGNTEVELIMTLTKNGSANPFAQSRIAQKFDGTARESVEAAIDQAFDEILAKIEE